MEINHLNRIDTSLLSSSDSLRQKPLTEVTEQRKPVQSPEQTVQPQQSVDLDEQAVDSLLSSVNDQFQLLNSSLTFEKDDATDKVIFSIKNNDTGEVIRQIPSENALEISRQLTEYLNSVDTQSLYEKSKTPVGLLTNQVV